jgi:hypothetical protein
MGQLARIRVGWLALFLLALAPLSGARRMPRTLTSVASSGSVARPLSRRARATETLRATVRRRLAEKGAGTYVGEMLAERDSALARWPDRHGAPLTVWIQPGLGVADWTDDDHIAVRDAFLEWGALDLPVHFAFVADSAAANVHVTFVSRFAEPISGRTHWTRDEDWWITDADIVLAVHHQTGAPLDSDAMHAMALHEVGHLLGLDHTDDATSVMAPTVRVRGLSSADRATVRLLYTLPPGGVR